jgi:hypothetical protein
MNFSRALWGLVFAALLFACGQKRLSRIEESGTNRVLKNLQTQPLYLADTDLELAIPKDISISKERTGSEWTTDGIKYELKRGDQKLCEVYLSRWASYEGHLTIKGEKKVTVGPWQGLWSEWQSKNLFDGRVRVDVPRKDWAQRTWHSISQRLSDIYHVYHKEKWPTDPKEQLKKMHEGEAEGQRAWREYAGDAVDFHGVDISYSDVKSDERDLVLEIAGSLKLEMPKVFSSTVDWYRPSPEEFQLREDYERLPDGLVIKIPAPRRDEATTLLDNVDILELTKEQAAHLATANPDELIESAIKQAIEALQSGSYPLNYLKVDVATLQKWRNELKPYLIKAVALDDLNRFEAGYYIDDLIVYQGVMGHHPNPMMRMPVIAFLPKKPTHVYTEVGMMD